MLKMLEKERNRVDKCRRLKSCGILRVENSYGNERQRTIHGYYNNVNCGIWDGSKNIRKSNKISRT